MPSSLGAPVQAANKSSGRKNFIFLNNWVDDVNTVCLFGQYNARLNDVVGQGECCFFIFLVCIFSWPLCVLSSTTLRYSTAKTVFRLIW